MKLSISERYYCQLKASRQFLLKNQVSLISYKGVLLLHDNERLQTLQKKRTFLTFNINLIYPILPTLLHQIITFPNLYESSWVGNPTPITRVKKTLKFTLLWNRKDILPEELITCLFNKIMSLKKKKTVNLIKFVIDH